ncbi:hypothetical protein J6A31_07535 [bacterium]|nr:hypothetical protein [bacterium]
MNENVELSYIATSLYDNTVLCPSALSDGYDVSKIELILDELGSYLDLKIDKVSTRHIKMLVTFLYESGLHNDNMYIFDKLSEGNSFAYLLRYRNSHRACLIEFESDIRNVQKCATIIIKS